MPQFSAFLHTFSFLYIIHDMKRLTVSILLLGYILLVPFCFLGTSITAFRSTVHQHDVHMNGPAIVSPCCNGQAETHDLAQHSVMYLIFTGTPWFSPVMFSAIVFCFAIGLNFFVPLLFAPIPQPRNSERRRRKSLFLRTQRDFLMWLARIETSPTLA